jgi:hypothetical protein
MDSSHQNDHAVDATVNGFAAYGQCTYHDNGISIFLENKNCFHARPHQYRCSAGGGTDAAIILYALIYPHVNNKISLSLSAPGIFQ